MSETQRGQIVVLHDLCIAGGQLFRLGFVKAGRFHQCAFGGAVGAHQRHVFMHHFLMGGLDRADFFLLIRAEVQRLEMTGHLL